MTTISLPQPNKAISKVLLGLITKDSVTEREYPFNSFRDIISTLRRDYKVPVRHVDVEGTNEFGRRYIYRRHFLLTISHKRAVKTYMKINS